MLNHPNDYYLQLLVTAGKITQQDADAAVEIARFAGVLPQPANVEAMLRACVPGGSIVDPQVVADNIREYLAQPASAHHDDLAVDRFAVAMKAKLAEARAKGRSGWETGECNALRLSDMLRAHVEKGDPRDVANFAMMLHQRGESILPANAQAGSQGEVDAVETVAHAIFDADAGPWVPNTPYPDLHPIDKKRYRAMAHAAIASSQPNVPEKSGTVSDYSDESLVKRAVRNAFYGRKSGRQYWELVAQAFGLGSTYAAQLCRRFGIDPDDQPNSTP